MLQQGTILNERYEIESLLGHGGMGTVYCAHDNRLGREVAIKILRPDLAADRAARERFLREGQIAAQIVHPNVVRTYDAGDDPAGTYLVQEFLTGRTLDQLLPLSPGRAAGILHGIAAALGYIHGRGYVHCDVKPQNILIKDTGVPVLLDFGIARAEGTNTTTLIATPHYLAPERAQGSAPTAASDLYALGIVLFQAVAGHPPFDATTLHGIIQQHIETPVPPLSTTEPAGRVLDRIIAGLTAKRPEERYVSADVAAADLAAAAGNAVHAQPTVAIAPPSGSAAAAQPPAAGTSLTVPRGSRLPPGLERVAAVWTAAPAWRRWIAVRAVPLLLLLLLGFGIARAPHPPEQPAAPASEPAISTLATATAQEIVAVPDVVGLQLEAARQMLEQRGLVAQMAAAQPDAQAAGIVLQSDPQAGTSLMPNSSVLLRISAGPAASAAPQAQDNLPPGDHQDTNPGKGKGKGKGKAKEKGD